jgi:hypothetical protein
MSGDQATAVAQKRGRFYVYQLFETPDIILYVGKGSGRRLQKQMRRFSLKGKIIKEFACEERAFECERRLIEIARPELNRNCGGAGGRVSPKPRERKTADERLMDRIGTRVFTARMLLRFDLRGLVEPGRLKRIIEVAHGAAI